jgi:RNA-directed DNA polymerase
MIAQPSRELKDIQRMLVRQVLESLPVHVCSRAYRKGASILDNAFPHRGTNPILKMDFKEFFPSIKSSDFENLCKSRNLGMAPEDIYFCKQILFWQPKGAQSLQLSIGAPSSPLLSNVMLYDLDCRISELCEGIGVTYTRYADDLTFSAPDVSLLYSLEKMIPDILRSMSFPRLTLNARKSVVITSARRRTVTGVVLSNDGRLTVGRDRKRLLRAKIDHLVKGTLSGKERLELYGWLAFIKSIEPQTYARLSATLIKRGIRLSALLK